MGLIVPKYPAEKPSDFWRGEFRGSQPHSVEKGEEFALFRRRRCSFGGHQRSDVPLQGKARYHFGAAAAELVRLRREVGGGSHDEGDSGGCEHESDDWRHRHHRQAMMRDSDNVKVGV